MAPATLARLQQTLGGTLHFLVSAVVVVIACAVALTLPPGKVGDAHPERMVMAEMTTIDAEHEPEG